MDNINDGGNAFPAFGVVEENGVPIYFRQQGMSFRDYFAGQALIGMLSNNITHVPIPADLLARGCYQYADAMLKAREHKNV